MYIIYNLTSYFTHFPTSLNLMCQIIQNIIQYRYFPVQRSNKSGKTVRVRYNVYLYTLK